MEKIKKKYIGTGAFYRRYLYLALPMILQNAITNLVSFLDNIMVGQLGTEQMSGVAIVNQLIFVYNLAIFGAASAASIFGAQYFGKGDHKGHMYSFRFKLYATLLVTVIAMTLFASRGSQLISLYLTDTTGSGATEVALKYGLQYLAVMLFGLIPFAVNQSYATNIKETQAGLVLTAEYSDLWKEDKKTETNDHKRRSFRKFSQQGTRKTGITVVIVFSVKSCKRPRMTIKNPVV